MARNSGDFADQWYDDESGGVSCACGRGCAEGDYAGNPKVGPRAFCETDTTHIGAAIRSLPEMYVELRLKLAKGQQQEERVSGSREAPTPLDLRVEAFMRHIILVAVSWEEQVRAAARLHNPDECTACKGEGAARDGRECRPCQGTGSISARDGAALQRACKLLGGETLSTLLMLEKEVKNRPVKGSTQLCELEPGSVVVIDSAGDAWEKRNMGGAEAGLEFLKLNGRARGMLGLTLQRRRMPLRCDGCEGLTLVQREALGGGWEAVVKCTACPQSYIGDDFEMLAGRWWDAAQKAERKAS